MRYAEFVQLLGEGHVTELQVESLEPQTFSYRVVMGERAEVLEGEDGQPVRLSSLGHARQYLPRLGGVEVPLFLVTQPPGSTIVGSQVYATSHKTRLDAN
ncbi:MULTISPECIES: DUF6482 family protein [unclassified Salinicola]|uniref:DUF6482 family protein n=1 Tax=unclassified Salinicola TaxID=2634022 RepID=UPI001A8CD91C|nr:MULTISPECIES: DUF6482 family protein [unclassified Salinicola]MCE3027426.1 DUF6482 family protein [Salinicola sp. DM10]WIX34083.1 DUF6482 family protein [Salinicola sp. JS01]